MHSELYLPFSNAVQAGAGKSLNVMFPMVSEPWEFDAARAVFDRQLAWLKAQKKILPEAIRYGAMLEVPALAEALDLLLRDAEEGVALEQTGFPDAIGERVYYEPVPRGLEIKLGEKLASLRMQRDAARQAPK